MARVSASTASVAALAAAFALAAPVRAQLLCQKTSATGKATFKLREVCKPNETEVQDGFLRWQSQQAVCLANTGGAPTAVFPGFQLPNGEWLLEGKVDVVNLASVSDYFRCSLSVDGQPADVSTAFLTPLQVGNLALIAQAPGGSTVALTCSHDGFIDNSFCSPGTGTYVEAGKLAGTNLRSFTVTPVP
jgi:hypothetical protein